MKSVLLSIMGLIAATCLMAGCSSVVSNGDPAWSPDGTKIAFVFGEGYDNDIWLMNADGSNQAKLTES